MNDWPANFGEIFWNAYPRRVAKKAAMRALDKVRRSGEVEFGVLIAAVQQFANAVSSRDMQFIPHPASWLNAGRWDDDVSAIAGKPATVADVFARLRDPESADHGWVFPAIGRQ